MGPVLISALAAAAVGVVGTVGVLVLARRSVVWAAVASPFVVVASLAVGIFASVRTMALPAGDSGTIMLVLAAT
ncbi:MAG: sensor histidine kinase, partial [Actinomycetota bacterium]